jgi:16S rRNA (cytosine967-C5)-methyltransferase
MAETRKRTARSVVTRRVAFRARLFPQLDINPIDVTGLDARDAALAIAIDHAVTRRWLTLVAVIESCLDRNWDRLNQAVQAPLLVGAAQLLLLDRLPDHAIINEAVQWTKSSRHPKAAGLVNAVLHRVAGLRQTRRDTHDPTRRDEVPLHDGGAWRLQRDIFDADDRTRLGELTSHPRLLLDQWTSERGPTGAATLAYHSLMHSPTIVTGVGAAEPDPDLDAHDVPGFQVYRGPRGTLTAFLERRPGSMVQDPGASAAAGATTWLQPKLIVDVCAGRGTKTRQLAALHPKAEIIATDVDEQRREDLVRAVGGHPRITVVEPSRLIDHARRADLLVLDVPCSNTAVLGRRLEARYRFDEASLDGVVSLQKQIVADTLPLLGDHGWLLYSTCSLQSAENDEQIRWITRWHDLEVATMRLCLPRGRPGDPPTWYSDGGFHALLHR